MIWHSIARILLAEVEDRSDLMVVLAGGKAGHLRGCFAVSFFFFPSERERERERATELRRAAPQKNTCGEMMRCE